VQQNAIIPMLFVCPFAECKLASLDATQRYRQLNCLIMLKTVPLKKMIDIGANLTDPMFRGVYHSSRKQHDDFQDMLSRSKEHGVARIIVTGGSMSGSQEAL